MNTALINAKEMTTQEVADTLREVTSEASVRTVEADKVVFDNGYTVKLYTVDSDGVEMESEGWHRPDDKRGTRPETITAVIIRSHEDCDFDYTETSVNIKFLSNGVCVASAPCVARTYYNTDTDCAVYLHVEDENGVYSRAKILVD